MSASAQSITYAATFIRENLMDWRDGSAVKFQKTGVRFPEFTTPVPETQCPLLTSSQKACPQ